MTEDIGSVLSLALAPTETAAPAQNRRQCVMSTNAPSWPRLLPTRLRGATAALWRWREALPALISRQEVFYLAAKLLGGGITARRYVVSSWQQNETRARDAAGKGSPDVERSDAIALNL
jgi:hypothetical protein